MEDWREEREAGGTRPGRGRRVWRTEGLWRQPRRAGRRKEQERTGPTNLSKICLAHGKNDRPRERAIWWKQFKIGNISESSEPKLFHFSKSGGRRSERYCSSLSWDPMASAMDPEK
jgi:hypothetical protein